MEAGIVWAKVSPFLVGIVFLAIVLIAFSRKTKQYYQDEGWRVVEDEDSVVSAESSADSPDMPHSRDNGAQ
ncbi:MULTISPECIES: hypothetical protein [Eikenella]|uniref:Uncharacterized protein n=1 Tax=Eikenella longinqua TaxID=1795827 RepID=A0A1A9RX84_9NEIS|nr:MULTISPECIES: hypothetical protein [Eikenella]OAM26897.1 hypothetical protein A7P95_09110 [Eikenella longinqua]